MKSLISLGRACGDVMGLVHGEAVAFCQGQREACDGPVSCPVATEALGSRSLFTKQLWLVTLGQ